MLLLNYWRDPQLCARACHEVLQVEKLRGMVGIRWLARIPAIDSFIAGLLPSLVLRIFLALLPELLAYMGRMQGLISLSQVQFSVVRRYFAFQVNFTLPDNIWDVPMGYFAGAILAEECKGSGGLFLYAEKSVLAGRLSSL